jgi:hypothetical protein
VDGFRVCSIVKQIIAQIADHGVAAASSKGTVNIYKIRVIRNVRGECLHAMLGSRHTKVCERVTVWWLLALQIQENLRVRADRGVGGEK